MNFSNALVKRMLHLAFRHFRAVLDFGEQVRLDQMPLCVDLLKCDSEQGRPFININFQGSPFATALAGNYRLTRRLKFREQLKRVQT